MIPSQSQCLLSIIGVATLLCQRPRIPLTVSLVTLNSSLGIASYVAPNITQMLFAILALVFQRDISEKMVVSRCNIGQSTLVVFAISYSGKALFAKQQLVYVSCHRFLASTVLAIPTFTSPVTA